MTSHNSEVTPAKTSATAERNQRANLPRSCLPSRTSAAAGCTAHHFQPPTNTFRRRRRCLYGPAVLRYSLTTTSSWFPATACSAAHRPTPETATRGLGLFLRLEDKGSSWLPVMSTENVDARPRARSTSKFRLSRLPTNRDALSENNCAYLNGTFFTPQLEYSDSTADHLLPRMVAPVTS